MGYISDSLVRPLKLVQVKNPFGIPYTNPQTPQVWVAPFYFLRKTPVFLTTFSNHQPVFDWLYTHDPWPRVHWGVWRKKILNMIPASHINDDPPHVLPLKVLISTRSTADVTEQILSRAPSHPLENVEMAIISSSVNSCLKVALDVRDRSSVLIQVDLPQACDSIFRLVGDLDWPVTTFQRK